MGKKPITERISEMRAAGLSKEEIVRVLYLEKYPIYEITESLALSSNELSSLNERLRLYLLRCPVGHKFLDDPALHAPDAHYCVECKRWFNEWTLKDEIELEVRRLKEKELRRTKTSTL
ncbi:hypothetical protein KEJ12_00450 [Candidatus Bathyarchaeota archaeon]|nr:hypothetical protein [Candidatus Bathyarchaeota archaeon]